MKIVSLARTAKFLNLKDEKKVLNLIEQGKLRSIEKTSGKLYAYKEDVLNMLDENVRLSLSDIYKMCTITFPNIKNFVIENNIIPAFKSKSNSFYNKSQAIFIINSIDKLTTKQRNSKTGMKYKLNYDKKYITYERYENGDVKLILVKRDNILINTIANRGQELPENIVLLG